MNLTWNKMQIYQSETEKDDRDQSISKHRFYEHNIRNLCIYYRRVH